MALEITYRNKCSVPVEVEGIVPDRLVGKELDEIRREPIFVGNEETTLGDLFDVAGDAAEPCIEWHGELAGVHWIGAKMKSGTVRIHGDVGRHVGSEMAGGEIHIFGAAGDWLGGELKGGLIHARGGAGHLVGAAYRGSRRGMTGGTILVEGGVGNELGHTMRRGLIVVGGGAGDLIGFNMLAGTILVLGEVGIRHGAGMKRGTIGFFGDDAPELLPTFKYACRFDSQALTLVYREVERLGYSLPPEVELAELSLYNGDFIEGGRGEILIRSSAGESSCIAG
ncbi:MAG: formylmethanofuran dehydrogenase subunit C [Pirellulaceae bacterium]|nr:formylmethanofuran dehydrogenase subunit C [Pirellulaceae bacterium]